MMSLNLLLLAPAAFLAGILMFLAPCTLPIVPGYLAFIAGGRGRVVRNAIVFVLGFSLVYILLGVAAGTLGSFIGPWKDLISRIAGIIIIVFGLTMLGLLRIPLLSSERHIRIPSFLTVGRPESSFLIGILFALGWSPCIGPILGSVLSIAASSASSTALIGAFLLAVFSLGLGIPFILCAIFLDGLQNTFAKWGRASQILSYLGSIVLILLGLLMLLGDMGLLIQWGYGLFGGLGYGRLLEHL